MKKVGKKKEKKIKATYIKEFVEEKVELSSYDKWATAFMATVMILSLLAVLFYRQLGI